MRRIVLLVAASVMLVAYSANASSSILDGQLVRQTLLSDDVKTLMTSNEEGNSLPVRIVYQDENLNTFQAYDPTHENLVIVRNVDIQLVGGTLVAIVQLNVNGKMQVRKVYTRTGVKAPWNLSEV
jgi:hypothetical protein